MWSVAEGGNGVGYGGSNESNLYGLDGLRGKVRWTHATENFVSSSPAVVNGVVYVGSEDGQLYAFDARTGTTLWIAGAGLAIRVSSPAVVNGMVYIGSEDRNVYPFDARSGNLLWRAPTWGYIHSSPSVANGMV